MTEKWRTEKVRRTRAEVAPFVALIVNELYRLNPGLELHVGGSWRRGSQTIGDLDVVLVTPNGQMSPDLLADFQPIVFPSEVEFQRHGDKIAQGDLTIGNITIHTDFWSCSPAERGAFLWFITGPKELNVAMRVAAIKQGLNLSQTGLYRDRVTSPKGKILEPGTQVDDGTELSVAEALGGRWPALLNPQARDVWAKPQGVVRTYEVEGSKGAMYTIKVEGERASCTCPGFRFRGECKHAKAAVSV